MNILEQISSDLKDLFVSWSHEEPTSFDLLPQSGSNRKYYRIISESHQVIGACNSDEKENAAFIAFTEHFNQRNLPVTEIYASDLSKGIYLQKDLGDETLYSFLIDHRTGKEIPPAVEAMYRKVVQALPKFQIQGHQGLDYNYCYPRMEFDRQSMMWDLNYFKYYFLKLARIPFDEQSLEEDFHVFCDFLLKEESQYFLYRDFQSRNIMLLDDEPYFIDYQGGRKGALQYDIASLLYDAKADLPQEFRNKMYELYVSEVEKLIPIDRDDFEKHYYGFVLIRMMQAFGAYGFRGYYEKKTHFLQSIPYALANLEWILKNKQLPVKIPTLLAVLTSLTMSERLRAYADSPKVLTVFVSSFSFRKGLPKDDSGNGGGFIFDCRVLPNPGRLEEYKEKTGMDKEVIAYLENQPEVTIYYTHVKSIVEMSVENYIQRGFTSLQINFGCTGGQHRSVYFAQRMADYLKSAYPINVVLVHREQLPVDR
jgi:aminoglycoside/choline kinase family phosphotransferase